MKKLLSSYFVTILLLAGCGGGGGSSSSASPQASANQSSNTNNSSSTTYSYDRIASDYTSKVWDTVSIGRFQDKDQQYLTDYSTDVVVKVTEKPDSAELDISGTKLFEGTSFSHNWEVNEANTDAVALVSCADTSLVTGYIATQSFANANTALITYDPTYLAGINIQYTDIALIGIQFAGAAERTEQFPIAFGDATAAGDLPTSGVKYYELDFYTFIKVWGLSGLSSDYKVYLAEGDANLDINFGSNQVSGEVVFKKYYDWLLWTQNGGCSGSQIFGVESETAQISGTLSNGDINAEISINSTDSNDGQISAARGAMLGTLFGPQGNEIGASFFFYEDTDTDTNDDLYYWDGYGVGIGD